MGDSGKDATTTTTDRLESPGSVAIPNNQTSSMVSVGPERGSASITSIVRRWKTEDLIKRSSLVLRALGLAFSFLSFIIMGSNKHGSWMEFDHYEEYRYCLSIAIVAGFYALCQVSRQVHHLVTGKEIVPRPTIFYIDFLGDQVTAYLLLSASSAAVPLTNRMRENNDNAFTDMSSAAISMAFFAFASLAASSLVSGFKLCRQTYI